MCIICAEYSSEPDARNLHVGLQPIPCSLHVGAQPPDTPAVPQIASFVRYSH